MMFVLCWLLGDTRDEHDLNVTVFVGARAAGWLVGTLVAPYDPGEVTLFGRIARAVSVYVSGYVTARIDNLTRTLADPAFIFQPLPGFRLLTFRSVATIVTIVVFFARRYSSWHLPDAKVLT